VPAQSSCVTMFSAVQNSRNSRIFATATFRCFSPIVRMVPLTTNCEISAPPKTTHAQATSRDYNSLALTHGRSPKWASAPTTNSGLYNTPVFNTPNIRLAATLLAIREALPQMAAMRDLSPRRMAFIVWRGMPAKPSVPQDDGIDGFATKHRSIIAGLCGWIQRLRSLLPSRSLQ